MRIRKELIYGLLHYPAKKAYSDAAKEQEQYYPTLLKYADGLIFVTPYISEHHVRLGKWCKENNIDFILAFNTDPENPDEEHLEKAKSITNRLAIGRTRTHEWKGDPGKAVIYKYIADKYKFEWVCTITHATILWDLKHGSYLRAIMKDTFCMCLCGHVLAGYLFNDRRIPDGRRTWLRGKNLHEKYGLTIENLTEYLNPLTIISGAGGQTGLDAGTRIYARKLGFKGLVIGLPFTLEGSNDVVVREKPDRYPLQCGM